MEEQDQQDVAQKVTGGEYFRDARDWYTTIYIAPISERTGFLLLATLAALVFFIGSLSVIDLMPINERRRLIIPNERMDSTVMSVHRLKEPGAGGVDLALKRFFAASYVYMRESYRYNDILKNQAFIKEHSDPIAFKQYVEDNHPSNKRSWAAMLRRIGERHIAVTDVKINNKVEPAVATVRFVDDYKKVKNAQQTSWTATLSFYYTDISINEVTNPATGRPKLKIEDPVFNVVQYTVVKSR